MGCPGMKRTSYMYLFVTLVLAFILHPPPSTTPHSGSRFIETLRTTNRSGTLVSGPYQFLHVIRSKTMSVKRRRE